MELRGPSVPSMSPHFKFGFLNLSDAPIFFFFFILEGVTVATDHEIVSRIPDWLVAQGQQRY